jgi:hypothetical protein
VPELIYAGCCHTLSPTLQELFDEELFADFDPSMFEGFRRAWENLFTRGGRGGMGGCSCPACRRQSRMPGMRVGISFGGGMFMMFPG